MGKDNSGRELPQSLISTVRKLRKERHSVRSIMRITGLASATVQKYIADIPNPHNPEDDEEGGESIPIRQGSAAPGKPKSILQDAVIEPEDAEAMRAIEDGDDELSKWLLRQLRQQSKKPPPRIPDDVLREIGQDEPDPSDLL